MIHIRNISRRGFTLVEVLIVVSIMAILVATIIPQFTDSTSDAQASSGKFNLRTLRAQIELYKAEHDGEAPRLVTGGLPQLVAKTDSRGAVGTSASHKFGPYLQQMPENPFTNSSLVVATDGPPTATNGRAGWLYDENNGDIWLNHEDHLND